MAALESEKSARIGWNATLSCEMSLYILNDSDFQWRFQDQLIISNFEKYTISYSDSKERDSQKGGANSQYNRLLTLSIFAMEASDVGNYTCFVSGTDQSATIQLSVNHSSELTAGK